MNAGLQNRWIMTALGLGAGLALYALGELIDADRLNDHAGLGLIGLTLAFFTALLAMAGPLGLRRALGASALIAGVAAALLVWASFRFDSPGDYLGTSLPFVAGAVLTLIPVPFAIALNRDGWRDYPTLFTESWDLVVRYAAALIFVGIVWAVILMSDALLKLVGLTVIADLLRIEAVPFAITGAALGLGMAVVTELEDMIAPDLFLRLLRLLLPVVLAVMAVFLLALPWRGLSGLFGGLSAAATLLTMLGLAATLVTTAIAQTEDEATDSPLLRLSARALALLMPVFAVLALWAVVARVGQYGWTPNRVTATVLAVLGLGYGALYGLAAGLGGPWMARIRQGNIRMAALCVLAAALMLTPVLNPQRIATNSQLARLDAGKIAPEAFDFWALDRWGRAGAAARAALTARAAEPGNEALAAAMARAPADHQAKLSLDTLRAGTEVLPATRTAEADPVLALLAERYQQPLTRNCADPDANGDPYCLLVFADFWPDLPGDEALFLARATGSIGWLIGLAREDGEWREVKAHAFGPDRDDRPVFEPRIGDVEIAAMMAALRAGLAPTTPEPLNRLTLGEWSVILLP